MKAKVAIVVLALLAVGMGVGWLLQGKQAREARDGLLSRINVLTGELDDARSEVTRLTEARTQLGIQVETLTRELRNSSNEVVIVRASMKEAVDSAAQAARLAEEELNRREARIAELEVTNRNLDRQAADAREMIADLEVRITETERRLASAEGDREFLMGELQRLQTEKAETERRFNDLVVLRAQVRKLQLELAADSQLDAIRAGLTRSRPLKGAELLMRGFPAHSRTEPSSVDLEVEIRRDGETTIEGRSDSSGDR